MVCNFKFKPDNVWFSVNANNLTTDVHIYALRCFQFWKSVYISSNVVLRTVSSCFTNSQDFNQLCCSYGVSIMGMNFSELMYVVYEHFRTSTM